MYSQYNKDKTCLSSKTPTCLIFKTLTFILYDIMNHPNIMGARRSCSKFGIFVDMLDISTQKLVLLHAGGGTGKTFVTCKIFEELARQNEICCCTCPTGVGALHLPQG
jgi:hypothetical protein